MLGGGQEVFLGVNNIKVKPGIAELGVMSGVKRDDKKVEGSKEVIEVEFIMGWDQKIRVKITCNYDIRVERSKVIEGCLKWKIEGNVGRSVNNNIQEGT